MKTSFTIRLAKDLVMVVNLSFQFLSISPLSESFNHTYLAFHIQLVKSYIFLFKKSNSPNQLVLFYISVKFRCSSVSWKANF